MVSPELGKLTFTEEVTRIMEVRRKYEKELLEKENVVGLGVGYRERDGKLVEDEVVLSVLVCQKVAPDQLEPDDLIPPVLDGVRTDVVEVLKLRALKK